MDADPDRRSWSMDESGLSAGAEALVFGVLVFVVGSMIALNAWAVLDAHLAAGAAAREATRMVVEMGAVARDSIMGDGDASGGEAHRVAAQTMRGHGKDPDLLEDPSGFLVTLVDDPWRSDLDRPDRCAPVTVEVHWPVTVMRLPIIGGWQLPITVVGRHSELTDPLRSGLAGTSSC